MAESARCVRREVCQPQFVPGNDEEARPSTTPHPLSLIGRCWVGVGHVIFPGTSMFFWVQAEGFGNQGEQVLKAGDKNERNQQRCGGYEFSAGKVCCGILP